MADRVICRICCRAIYSNRPTIHCESCVDWCHKGCSGLNSAEQLLNCHSLAKLSQLGEKTTAT